MLLLLEAINLHTLGTSSQYAGLLTVRLVLFLLQQILFHSKDETSCITSYI